MRPSRGHIYSPSRSPTVSVPADPSNTLNNIFIMMCCSSQEKLKKTTRMWTLNLLLQWEGHNVVMKGSSFTVGCPRGPCWSSCSWVKCNWNVKAGCGRMKPAPWRVWRSESNTQVTDWSRSSASISVHSMCIAERIYERYCSQPNPLLVWLCITLILIYSNLLEACWEASKRLHIYFRATLRICSI